MADVFIVYTTRDPAAERTAALLAEALRPQWTVFWDNEIVGEFTEAIDDEMAKAKCVIPIWSPNAKASPSVHDELTLAREQKIPMIPISIADCRPPYSFGRLSSVKLHNFDGGRDHQGFRNLCRKLNKVVPQNRPPERSTTFAGKSLPSIFFSVSGHETRLQPIQAIKALRVFGARTALVSAYDLAADPAAADDKKRRSLIYQLKRLKATGATILIDSGNYEASRKQDDLWDPDAMHRAIVGVPHDFLFSFDVAKPSTTPSIAARQICTAVAADRASTDKPIIPIVHAPRGKSGVILDNLPELIHTVASELQPPIIAIPERELGPGLIASAATVMRIRLALDALPFYQSLHLLGTGNPWSIAVLAAAGADSFDGLEWCRVVADDVDLKLSHFQHFDFVRYQAKMAKSPITQGAIASDKVDFAGKIAFHNLEIMTNFATRLQEKAKRGGLKALALETVGSQNAKELERRLPELFK